MTKTLGQRIFDYWLNIIDPAVTWEGYATLDNLRPMVPLWKRILLGTGAGDD